MKRNVVVLSLSLIGISGSTFMATKLMSEFEILSERAKLCIVDNARIAPSWKTEWWIDQDVLLKRMNSGVGLIGDRPAWFRVRVFKGKPESSLFSVLAYDTALICSPEQMRKATTVFGAYRKQDRPPGGFFDLRKGLHRYHVTPTEDAVEIHFEFVSKDLSRMRFGDYQTVPKLPVPTEFELSEEQEVDALVAGFVFDLWKARMDRKTVDDAAVQTAIETYLTRGTELSLSPMHLADYFSISSPSIPDRAGYTAKLSAAVEKQYFATSTGWWG